MDAVDVGPALHSGGSFIPRCADAFSERLRMILRFLKNFVSLVVTTIVALSVMA